MRRNTIEDFWAKVDVRGPDDCWLWTRGVSRSGYGTINMAGKVLSAHRVAYEAHHGVTLTHGRELIVCHRCDQPLCCNPAHLFLGTQKDNAQDRKAKGRQAPARRGSANEWAKFTDDQVREIRALHATGEWSYPRLGARFGMHPQNIGRIVRREGYADVI